MTINDWLGWVAVVWQQYHLDTAAEALVVFILAIIGWRWLRGRE